MGTRRRQYKVFDKNKAQIRGVAVGFGCLILGFILMGVYNWIAGGLFNAALAPKTSNIIAVVFALVCGAVAYFSGGVSTVEEIETDYWCQKCGNRLGTSPPSFCVCGSNRFTTEDPGVGDAIRIKRG